MKSILIAATTLLFVYTNLSAQTRTTQKLYSRATIDGTRQEAPAVQTRTVTLQVIDAKTKEAIQHAHIRVEALDLYNISTNEKGEARFEIPADMDGASIQVILSGRWYFEKKYTIQLGDENAVVKTVSLKENPNYVWVHVCPSF